MSIGLLFWLLFVLWIVLYGWGCYCCTDKRTLGGSILLVVLVFLLGWHAFGFIVQGP